MLERPELIQHVLFAENQEQNSPLQRLAIEEEMAGGGRVPAPNDRDSERFRASLEESDAMVAASQAERLYGKDH